MAAIAAALLLSACHGIPHTYLVTVFTDGPDANPGDGICEMTAGAGDCSLRAAIDEVNAGGDTSSITLPAGTYTLSDAGVDDDNVGGDLDLNLAGRSITISGSGPGGARIDAGGADGVLELHAGALVLADVGTTGASGPGISVRGTSTVSLQRAAAFGNGGPGLAADPGTTVNMANATVSGNGAGGIDADGILNAEWTTVTDNDGGGVTGAGSATVGNSVLAGQASGPDCSTEITTTGHNVDGDDSCGLTDPTDLPDASADLAPLSSDLVPFHAPEAASVAIDSVPTATCVDAYGGIDQRSEPRPAGSECDRGAVEVQPPPGPPLELAVTSVADVGDTDPGDGVCVAGTPAAPAVEPPADATSASPTTSPTSTTAPATPPEEGPAQDGPAQDGPVGEPAASGATTTTSTLPPTTAPPTTVAPDLPEAPANSLCTLRAAIQEANARAAAIPGHRTVISLAAGETYPLDVTSSGADEDDALTGDLDIRSDIEIVGAGATVTSTDLGEGPDHRVFDVHGGGELSIATLGVTGGHTNGDGGGIRVADGALRITDSSVWDNIAGGEGGGIAIDSSAAAGCRRTACTITQSTVAGNRAATGAGVSTGGSLGLEWTTIADNAVPADAAPNSDAVDGVLATDVVTLTGTLITSTDRKACDGLVVVRATSVADDRSCAGSLASDEEITWPRDDTNGLPVHPPTSLVEQLLIDNDAVVTTCPPADQTQRPRPRGASCDPGSVESIDIVAVSLHDALDPAPNGETCSGPNGLCTLRAAVALANAVPGPDRIVLSADLRYELSIAAEAGNDSATGDLDITDDLTITGQGATIDAGWRPDDEASTSDPGLSTLTGVVTDEVTGLPVEGIQVLINTNGVWASTGVNTDAAGRYRVTNLDPAAVNKVRFNDFASQYLREYWNNTRNFGAASPLALTADTVTTADAALTPNPAAPPPATPLPKPDVWGARDRVFEVSGGARLTLDHVEVIGGNSTGDGGGVLVTDGTLVTERSTIQRSNAAGLGGGVHVAPGGTAELRQTTVSNNQASNGSGVSTLAATPLVLDWSTVADNASHGGGAGVFIGGPTHFRGSLIGYHRDLDVADGIAPDCTISGGSVTTEHVNMDTYTGGGGSCGLPANMTIDPAVYGRLLLPLDQLVGGTPTHGLLPEIETVVAGVIGVATGDCPGTDQRDMPRNRVRASLAAQTPDLCEPGSVEFAPWLFIDHEDDQGDATDDAQCTASPTTDGCRLRAAVMEANRYPGPDVIILHDEISAVLDAAGAGEDGAATGDLDITDDLTIRGYGSTVDATALGDRAIEVRDGATLTISQLELIGSGGVPTGGVIEVSSGALHLDRSTVVGGTAGEGGGVNFGASSSGGSIRHSTVTGGSATNGGGVATRAPQEVEIAWSTITDNTASGLGGGLLVGGPLRTEGSLIAGQQAGGSCQVDGGAVTAEGGTILGDAACAGSDDQVVAGGSLEPLGEFGGPTRTHPVGAGLIDLLPAEACDSHDQQGAARPQGNGCEPGAVEHVPGGSSYELIAMTTPNGPMGLQDLDEDSDGARFPQFDAPTTYVHASRLAAFHYLNDSDRGDRAFEALMTRSFPAFKDPATAYPRRNWGEFAFPQLLRLEVIEQPPSWTGNRYRPLLQEWGQEFAERECDLAGDFGSATDPDPWFRPFDDSENLALMRRSSCLLAHYAWGAPGAWEPWAEAIAASLAARARTGVLEEFNSPTYVQHSVGAILNLVDFPTGDPGSADELIRGHARSFLDLHWHLFAHEYNPTTGVGGLSGNRLRQPDPLGLEPPRHGAGDQYVYPSEGWVPTWMRLFDWAPRVHPLPGSARLALNGAVSDYRPLDVSRQLALDPDKEFSATFARPGLTTVPAIDTPHQLAQSLDVHPDYMLGAHTYGPGDGLHHMGQTIFFSASFDGDERDRLVMSGVATNQDVRSDVFSDMFAVNGVVHEGVSVVLPDTRAENVVGPSQRVRLYLGSTDLRANLTVGAEGWYLTHNGVDGDASTASVFVAARSAGTPTVVCNEEDQAEPCSSDELRREIRSDSAIVVQVIPASEFDDGNPATDDFADLFVPTFPTGRWTEPSGGDTAFEFESWAGDTFRFESEWDAHADIQINGENVDVSSLPRAYDSPYFCDLDPNPASPQIIGVRGPGQATCEDVLDFG